MVHVVCALSAGHCIPYGNFFTAFIVFFTITGDGFYIYIEASQPAQRSAELLSPLIRGPKCLRFYYHMPGLDVGNLDVSLHLREQPGAYLMWRKSGEQDDQWMKTSVDIGYTGECQVGREQGALLK